MSLTKYNKFQQQYEPRLSSIINLPGKGLESLSVFVHDLEAGFVGIKDDTDHIKQKLQPSITKTQSYFGRMMEKSEKLLQQINNDFESCVLDIKAQRDKIKKINHNLVNVKKHLQHKERDVRDAECQCRRKYQELSDAESAFQIASKKFENEKASQIGVVIGGYTAMTISLLVSILFPPALIRAVGGAVTTVVGMTNLQDLRNRVFTAMDEVSSSKIKLEIAKKSQATIERQLSDLKDKKNRKEKILNNKNRLLEKIKIYQKDIIELKEKIKHFYSMLCNFSGRCNVLNCESKCGYKLDSLKLPTSNVCYSLSSLFHCEVLQLSCEQQQLECMKVQLLQIHRVQWPSVAYEENDLI